MTAEALPLFTGGMTDAFARGVKGIAESLRPAPGRAWPEEVAGPVAEVAPVLASVIRKERERLTAALRTGIPAGLAAELEMMLPALESLIGEAAALEQARGWKGLPPSAEQFFRAMEELQTEAEKYRRVLAPLVAKAKAPLPSIDQARLRAGREALGRGEFKRYAGADEMVRDLTDAD